jgi:hypothetical protein
LPWAGEEPDSNPGLLLQFRKNGQVEKKNMEGKNIFFPKWRGRRGIGFRSVYRLLVDTINTYTYYRRK